MAEVRLGIIGLGNVGSGTLSILAENGALIAEKLGFPLRVTAVCARQLSNKKIPEALAGAFQTTDWREVVNHPEVDVVAELVGGTTVAREIVETAHRQREVRGDGEQGADGAVRAGLWERAIGAGVNLAMEASVAGGIPIHAVLREGISGDRIMALLGILNGTSNYILTEIEKPARRLTTCWRRRSGWGMPRPIRAADVDGYDARSKLAILSALAFGEKIHADRYFHEGNPAHHADRFPVRAQLGHTIRLICGARQTPEGLILSVRPALIPQSTILAGVQGAYNAIWVSGKYGEDTFYYGRGAGPEPTGVAVVSDLMRVAREIRCGEPGAGVAVRA